MPGCARQGRARLLLLDLCPKCHRANKRPEVPRVSAGLWSASVSPPVWWGWHGAQRRGAMGSTPGATRWVHGQRVAGGRQLRVGLVLV
jgi:hypothetical protein